jgi:hypothetical protein
MRQSYKQLTAAMIGLKEKLTGLDEQIAILDWQRRAVQIETESLVLAMSSDRPKTASDTVSLDEASDIASNMSSDDDLSEDGTLPELPVQTFNLYTAYSQNSLQGSQNLAVHSQASMPMPSDQREHMLPPRSTTPAAA